MECASSARAIMPSKKSNTALKIMKASAHSYLASNAMTQAIHPENRFRQVRVFGIWRVMQFAIVVLLLFKFGYHGLIASSQLS